MKPGLPVWRSLLYVPVNVEKYVEKAHTRGADCILLDLEDSVPAHEKDNARKLVARAAARVRRGGADVAVRINRPDAMAPRDLEASIGPDVNAIAVTKVDDAAHLRRLDELVSKLEAKRGLAAGHTRYRDGRDSRSLFPHARDRARGGAHCCDGHRRRGLRSRVRYGAD